MTGWLGNIFILLGIILLAYKKRPGFICGIIGNGFWCLKGVATEQYDLVSIEILIVVLQAFSWWKWGRAKSTNRIYKPTNR